MRAVYVCHPFRGDEQSNRKLAAGICKRLAGADCLPLCPQLRFPLVLDESRERELAMALCLRLVGLADELRIYGKPTAGMTLEIAEAERLGIPVIYAENR